MSEAFCFLVLFLEISAFLYYDPVHDSAPTPPVSEIKSIYGDSILLHLPQKSG